MSIFLVLVSLVLFIMLLWLAVLHWQTRCALRWWYEEQQQWLWHEAEHIRNGLLQETFVMRRSLELSLNNPDKATIQHQQGWIERVNHLDRALVQLSDGLSLSRASMGLPWAIETAVAQAMEHVKGVESGQSMSVDLKVPSAWQPEPVSRSQVVVDSLIHLLRLVRVDPAAITQVRLSDTVRGGLLVVQIDYSTPELAAQSVRSPRSTFLRRAFQVLAAGQAHQQRQGRRVVWQFRWALSQKPSHVDATL